MQRLQQLVSEHAGSAEDHYPHDLRRAIARRSGL
jgi:hypothetical protein